MASIMYSPSRQARVAKLNTIIEDDAEPRGRPRSTSRSSESSPVPSSASTLSSYYESVRNSTHWEPNDLYDSPYDDRKSTKPTLVIRPASGATDASNRDSWITDTSISPSTRCPSMVIPSPRHWPTIQKFQAGGELPLTPTQMPISPLALSRLQNQPPMPSRTPSLDGSLTSGETISSIPTTPDVEANPARNIDWNRVDVAGSDIESACEEDVVQDKSAEIEINVRLSTGCQLPQNALSFLQHLSLDTTEVSTPTREQEEPATSEMIEVPLKLSTKPSFESVPMSATSEYSISELSIPSPGGFLASLDESSRNTWAVPAESTELGSAVAEQFYNMPWSVPAEAVKEQVVEIRDDDTQGPITAMRLTPATAKLMQDIPVFDETEPKDYDDNYQQDLQKAAEMSMDRTSLWLREQRDFIDEKLAEPPKPAQAVLPSPAVAKKAVKFLDIKKANKDYKKGPSTSGSDPLFYQAFQHMSNLSSPTDSFTARQARYDALQARRSSVSKTHVDAVIGKYHTAETVRPAPQRPISMMPGHNELSEHETEEQKVFTEAARERDALEQLAPSMWVVEALRYLSGGRLLNSPAATVLRGAPAVPQIRDSKVRVLDLGGQPSCDWAWHCAREFPNVKTYTATSDPRITEANLRGPSNHRLEFVDHLWALPFPDNHFDAISARSLFAHLKLARVADAPDALDQLDACLAECMRVLRPGGYLEFFVLDAEVVRGGPRGTAASAEFGFKLRQRGYEPNPTKSWLGRVRRAGFTDIKRAWMFLPMGALRDSAGPATGLPETPPPRASFFEERIKNAEAVRGPVGSSADVAEVSGLVGSWMWEQWVMKLEMEMGKGKGLLGATVGGVVEEGRKTGSGWRSLSGWCQKPLA